MKEYIEREAAKELHCKICKDKYVCYRGENCEEIKLFNTLPKADVKKVVHARWENHTHCTACGWAMEDDVAGGYYMVAFPYCPNCGATMDESEEL